MSRPPEPIPADVLRQRRIPVAPGRYQGSHTDYVARILDPVLPEVGVVEAFHRALRAYVERADALFLVRAVTGTKRGETVRTNGGIAFRSTDNAPAWWWHAALYNGVVVAPAQLAGLIDATPCHMFHVGRTPTVSDAGWYVGHLLNVKDGNTDWQRWPRPAVVRRFIRNIHPCNVFYVPKANGQQVSSDPRLIASIAARYRERYASIWDEFAALAGAPARYGEAAPDGFLTTDSTVLPGRATNRIPKNRMDSVDAVGTGTWWRVILQVDHAPPVGVLLASHPDAPALTGRLLAGLTVERLVAIADALHNKCRVTDLQAAAPGNRPRQVALAWENLTAGAAKVHVRPSGWTGTAKLLSHGQVDGLTGVALLDIGTLAGVCARIVRGPYHEACDRGLR